MKQKSMIVKSAVRTALCVLLALIGVFSITAAAAQKNYTVDCEITLTVFIDGQERTLYGKKMMCDLNADGKFNSADAAALLRIAAKRDEPPEDISPFDLDEDGSLKAGDARLALRYSARLDQYYCFADESVPSGFVDAADGAGKYWFSSTGVRASGERTIDGEFYWFDGSTGLMLTGFQNLKGRRYHFEADGRGTTGEARSDDGKSLLFEKGAAVAGFRTVDGKSLYFENGEVVSGFRTVDARSLYFENGEAVSGFRTVDGESLCFENGEAVNGFRTVDGKTCYYENGRYKTDWQQIDGKWYFFGADGAMTLGSVTLGGLVYDFGTDGVSKTGREGKTPRIAVIGDSIVASLAIYLSDPNVDFYGKVSLHADTIFSKKMSGSSRYIIDEITGRGYNKVIVLLGVNDLTYGDGPWGEMYRKVIRGVKERAPEAEVIAHGITPVNDSRARSHGYGDTTMARVRNKNSVIASVASQEGVRYIDAVSVMTDGSGQLPYDAANDGIHFGAKYCNIWLDWLKKTV